MLPAVCSVRLQEVCKSCTVAKKCDGTHLSSKKLHQNHHVTTINDNSLFYRICILIFFFNDTINQTHYFFNHKF